MAKILKDGEVICLGPNSEPTIKPESVGEIVLRPNYQTYHNAFEKCPLRNIPGVTGTPCELLGQVAVDGSGRIRCYELVGQMENGDPIAGEIVDEYGSRSFYFAYQPEEGNEGIYCGQIIDP